MAGMTHYIPGHHRIQDDWCPEEMQHGPTRVISPQHHARRGPSLSLDKWIRKDFPLAVTFPR